jgi:hypothetical protein
MSEEIFRFIGTQLFTIVFLLGPAMLLLLAGKKYGWNNWTQIGLAVGWIIIALIVLQMTVWGSLAVA